MTTRILCLHGFTSNSAVHAFQLRRLIAALPPSQGYEFLFPDGPHQVQIQDAMDMTQPANQTWHDFVFALDADSPRIGHRAWWYARDSRPPPPPPTATSPADSAEAADKSRGTTKGDGAFLGLEASFSFLGTYLAQQPGPISAVIGFSQGACLAGMLCALLQPSQSQHPLRKLLPPSQPTIACGVIFSGFRARFEQYDDIYESAEGKGLIDVPVLHVIGTRDPLVGSERSEALIKVCNSDEGDVLKFEGGHEIPKNEEDVGRIVDFVRRWVRGDDEEGSYGRVQASM